MRLGNLRKNFKNKEFKTAVITAAALLSVIVVVLGGYIVGAINDSGNTADLTGVIVSDDDDYDDSLAAENGYSLEGHNCFDLSEYENKLATQESDIEGWTKLDKEKAGLLPQDGSDTDGDGLTDKEEIEVYGSDPLKKSTAGDLYADSYKVEHSMDLFTYYEYDQEIVFENNECSELIFEATDIDDLSVNARYEDTMPLNSADYSIYKGFFITNYTGSIGFDVSQIVQRYKVDPANLIILSGDYFGVICQDVAPTEISGSDLQRYGNILYIKQERKSMKVYYIAQKLKKNIGLAHLSERALFRIYFTRWERHTYSKFSLISSPLIQYLPRSRSLKIKKIS